MIEVLAKISSILYCILKYILQKMYVVEKKITGWIVLQYKIIITKYQNIAINSFSFKLCLINNRIHKLCYRLGPVNFQSADQDN
jgi:hypothetical protein